jgi:hypothetical protein
MGTSAVSTRARKLADKVVPRGDRSSPPTRTCLFFGRQQVPLSHLHIPASHTQHRFQADDLRCMHDYRLGPCTSTCLCVCSESTTSGLFFRGLRHASQRRCMSDKASLTHRSFFVCVHKPLDLPTWGPLDDLPKIINFMRAARSTVASLSPARPAYSVFVKEGILNGRATLCFLCVIGLQFRLHV